MPTSPSRAASISGVSPSLLSMCSAAALPRSRLIVLPSPTPTPPPPPDWTSQSTAARWPCITAICSAVLPNVSAALNRALRASLAASSAAARVTNAQCFHRRGGGLPTAAGASVAEVAEAAAARKFQVSRMRLQASIDPTLAAKERGYSPKYAPLSSFWMVFPTSIGRGFDGKITRRRMRRGWKKTPRARAERLAPFSRRKPTRCRSFCTMAMCRAVSPV